MNKRVIERNMFYGAKKNIFQKAADLRNNMTLSEEKLWEILHDRKVFRDAMLDGKSVIEMNDSKASDEINNLLSEILL